LIIEQIEYYEKDSYSARGLYMAIKAEKSKTNFESLKNSFFKEYQYKSIGDKTIYRRDLFYLTFIYQKLSQKASPNTGGDEWPCPLF
jgi:hypothetical protein